MVERHRRRVLLLGAGHAHLYALKRTAEFTRRGIELVLVSPDGFWYSGLATGMLGGMYPPSLDRVDAGGLAERGGGRWVRDRVARIDPDARRVRLDGGGTLAYDAVSLNLGSRVAPDAVPGAEERAYRVKPIRELWRLRRFLERRFRARRPTRAPRITVVGGGPSGCEVAANLSRLARACGARAGITLLASGERLLERLPRAAGRTMRRVLEDRGVRVRLGSRVRRIEDGSAVTEAGRRIASDLCVVATGLTPSPVVRTTGLPTSADGALLVDDRLRSVAEPRVFGGGDCVALEGRELARVGVYAIREAPVLFRNLLATVEGRALERYEPQRRFLLILNLGDGTGLATRGPFHWHGRLAFWLKDRIDRRFLNTYRESD